MLQNMKDNGVNVRGILLGFLLIIIFVIIGIFIFNMLSINDYVIVSESCIISKKNGQWFQIKEPSDDLLNKKYTVVGDFGTRKNVIINYNEDNNEFYYMDSNYKDLNIDKPYVAFTEKFNKINTTDYNVQFYDSSDDIFIKKAIGDKDINLFTDSLFKYICDLNGDGKKEIIYTTTDKNLNGLSGNYSYIFLVSDGKYIGKLDKDSSKPYMIRGIIDLDGDGNFEIIVSKGDIDISAFNSNYMIFNYKNNIINTLLK